MKLGKKVYVYGAILTASLVLLGSQALVKKPDAPVREPAPSRKPDAPVQAATPSEPDDSPVEQQAPGASSTSSDARVERLESSLSALQALLPADRTRELEAIGRAWAAESPAKKQPEPEQAAPVEIPESAPVEQASARADVPAQEVQVLDSAASNAASGATPARDPLQTWLAANPLTAIAVGPSRGLASFGNELFAAGDQLPFDLGVVQRIEARGVVLSRDGSLRRIPLSAFVPRPNDDSTPPSAPSTPTAAPLAPVGATPEGSSLFDILQQTVKKISDAEDAEAALLPAAQGTGTQDAKKKP